MEHNGQEQLRFRLSTVQNWRHFVELRQEWNKLAETHPWRAYLDHDWCRIWWKSFGQGRMQVLRGECDGEPIALVPLWQHKPAISRWQNLLANAHSPRQDFLIRPGWESCFYPQWMNFLQRRRDWDILDLPRLSPATTNQVKIVAHGLIVRERGRLRQRHIDLSGGLEAAENGFSASLRNNLRRRQRQAQNLGLLALEVQTGLEGLPARLKECFAIEASGWKGQAGTAILLDPEAQRFYSRLAFALARQHRLRLFLLRLNERAIAFDYCLYDHGRLGCLKIGYENSLHRYSPGSLLRQRLLSWAVQEGCERYEFLGVDQPWMADWSPRIEEQVNLRLYNATARGRLLLWRARAHAGMVKPERAGAEAAAMPAGEPPARFFPAPARNAGRHTGISVPAPVPAAIAARQKLIVPQWPTWRLRDLRLGTAPPFPFSPAAGNGNSHGQLSWHYEARNAIFALPAALGWKAGDEVLLPAFHHGIETAALEAAGMRVVYYRVCRDLSLDLADAAARLSPRTRGLYIIHYFGKAQPMPQLKQFARRHQLNLIEDCALSLYARSQGQPTGSYGDAAIFCLHKTYPAPHGALLWLAQPPVAAALRHLRRPPLPHTLSGLWRGWLAGFECEHPATGQRLRQASARLRWRERVGTAYAMPGMNRLETERLNWTASRLVALLTRSYDWRQIVLERRHNYDCLRRSLLRSGWPEPIEPLTLEAAPLFLLLRVPQKDEFCRRLWKSGIGAVSTWREGPENASEFPESAELRRTLIELPIHQGLNRERLSYTAQQCLAIYQELRQPIAGTLAIRMHVA